MSIQNVIRSKFGYFWYLKDKLMILIQFISRFSAEPSIFFRYRRMNTHPSFDRFYDFSPIPYSNFNNSYCCHWINYPASLEKPFIIEVNDHPLSALTYFDRRIREPRDLLSKIYKCQYIYGHENCKLIIVPCSAFKSILMYYIGKEIVEEKVKIICSPGAIPNIYFDRKYLPDSGILKFLCLCSDFYSKGLDLVLAAWMKLDENDRSRAMLTIACPNIPNEYDELLKRFPSIVIYNLAPLDNKLKSYLLETHQVTIAPTHIHGGANIFEGMENSHAIIYSRFHSSLYENIGIEIDMPYSYYDVKYFGIEWGTMTEYMEFLKNEKDKGVFRASIDSFTIAFTDLIRNPELVSNYRRVSWDAACGSHSLSRRNLDLARIYKSYSI